MSHTDINKTAKEILTKYEKEIETVGHLITATQGDGPEGDFSKDSYQEAKRYTREYIVDVLQIAIDRIREEERERTHTDTFHAKGSGQCSCVYNSRGDQVGMCLRCSELTDKAYKKGYEEGGKDDYEPNPNCTCPDCSRGEYCPACEDFGCNIVSSIQPMKTKKEILKQFREKFNPELSDGFVDGIKILDAYQSTAIEAFLSDVIDRVERGAKEKLIKDIDNKLQTITQMGFDSENRFKQDEKTELHNRGRAFGYTEAISDIKNLLSSPPQE